MSITGFQRNPGTLPLAKSSIKLLLIWSLKRFTYSLNSFSFEGLARAWVFIENLSLIKTTSRMLYRRDLLAISYLYLINLLPQFTSLLHFYLPDLIG